MRVMMYAEQNWPSYNGNALYYKNISKRATKSYNFASESIVFIDAFEQHFVEI